MKAKHCKMWQNYMGVGCFTVEDLKRKRNEIEM
jgi:hypothetical protein